MNGVIIDDEAIHELAFRKVCHDNLEKNLTSNLYNELCMGKTDEAGFKDILKHFGIHNADITSLVQKKTNTYLKLIPKNIKSCPGVLKLIDRLSKKYRLALTSSSSNKEVEMVTTTFNIKE